MSSRDANFPPAPNRTKTVDERPATRGGRSIAVTGGSGFLGRRLLARLEADLRVERVLALDLKPPPGSWRKTAFERIDLASPRTDAQVAQALRQHEVDTLVHLALFFNPIQNAAYAHEVEVIGTLQLLSAADAAGLGALLLCSTTSLYGAHADNPNYLREEAPLRPPVQSRYQADKLEVERQVTEFAQGHPQVRVGVLRLGSMLGPTVKNPATRLFGRPLVPVVLGRDPLMQFLHEEDAIRALHLAVLERPIGALNIVPPGVLPLTSVLAMLGRTPLPLPAPLAQGGLTALWSMFGVGMPPSWLDYLRYLWVADGTRATEVLGLHYQYTTRETVMAYSEALQATGRSNAVPNGDAGGSLSPPGALGADGLEDPAGGSPPRADPRAPDAP